MVIGDHVRGGRSVRMLFSPLAAALFGWLIMGCTIVEPVDDEPEEQEPAVVEDRGIDNRGSTLPFTRSALVYYGGGPILHRGDEQWLARHDLICIDRFRHDEIDGDTWSAIKAISPETEIYLYVSSRVHNAVDDVDAEFLNNISRYDQPRGHSMGSLNGDHPDLFLTDTAGNRIYSENFSEPAEDQFFYVMDYSDPRYSDFWLEAVLADVVSAPWAADGIFCDNLSPVNRFDLSGTPVQMPTLDDWAAGIHGYVERVATGLSAHGVKVLANRTGTASEQGADAWLLLDHSDAAPEVVMEEGAFVVKWGNGDAQFRSRSAWQRQLDILGSIQNSKVIMVAHTDLPEGGSGVDHLGQPIDYYQVLWYAWTSYQLGKTDRSYFSFHGASSYTRDWWYDEYADVDLGASVGDYQVISVDGNDVFFREFEDGWVFVNPSRNAVVDIPLPEPLRKLDHDTFMAAHLVSHRETLALAPYTGTILIR